MQLLPAHCLSTAQLLDVEAEAWGQSHEYCIGRPASALRPIVLSFETVGQFQQPIAPLTASKDHLQHVISADVCTHATSCMVYRAMEEQTQRADDIKQQLCRTDTIPFNQLALYIEMLSPEVFHALAWHDEFQGQWRTQGRGDVLRNWLQAGRQTSSVRILQRPGSPEQPTAAQSDNIFSWLASEADEDGDVHEAALDGAGLSASGQGDDAAEQDAGAVTCLPCLPASYQL